MLTALILTGLCTAAALASYLISIARLVSE
jgi:hypothetical protein